MGQKHLFLYRIYACICFIYTHYCLNLVKLMFSQYESGMMLQEWFKYIRSNYFIVLFSLVIQDLTLIYKTFFLLPYKI